MRAAFNRIIGHPQFARGAAEVKKKGWFKRIDHGEYLGKEISNPFNHKKQSKLLKQLQDLSNWIEDV